MNEEWRKQLQKKLDGHRLAAPQLSWNKVESQLALASGKTKTPFWGHRIMAAAAMVALIGGAGVAYLLLNNKHNAAQVANIERQNAPQQLATQRSANNQMAGDNNTQSQQQLPHNNLVAGRYITNSNANYPNPNSRQTQGDGLYAANNSANNSAQVVSSPQNNIPTTAANQDYTSNNTSKNSTDNYPRRANTTETHPKRTDTPQDALITNRPKGQRGGGAWTATAYVSGGTVTANNTELQRPALAMARAYGNTVDEEIRKGDYVQLQDALPAVETNTRHYQPFRVGAAARYELNHRWSIDAGLAYTRHRSDITRRTGTIVNETQQTLHYLGVPLNIHYRIVGTKRFNVYASAGVMGEKLLTGKRTTDVNYNGLPDGTQTESVKEKPVQVSVNAAIGAEYKFSGRLSIFAEPGIGYYFGNGSDLNSIYKERPTNFNLNVGLRFGINK